MNDNNILPACRLVARAARRGTLALGLSTLVFLGGCLSGGGGGGDASASGGSSSTAGTSAATTTSGSTGGSTGGSGTTGSTTPPQTANAIQVGPARAIKTIAAAAAAARDGDTVEIDAGTYTGDVAVWTQRNLTIRGVGGRPRLDAGGTSAEGKAIFVVRGDNVTIENIAMVNCRVPDQNGAGIRHETGRLIVRNVVFDSNENGILTGAGSTMTLDVIDSQFINNGYGDGQSHNLYVGDIARFTAQGSWFTRARIGHLLKSRARQNFILYNRLTDETGTASYELEFPNGGMAFVIGNLIQQTATTDNTNIVAYGMEGLPYSANELYLAHNTIVNDRSAGGVFVAAVAGSTATLVNNLFVGPGSMALNGASTLTGNASVTAAEFVNPATYDYRLTSGSARRGTVAAGGTGGGQSLVPTRQYVHPASSQAITAPGAWSPGAFQ
jgi:hypothetical protein